MGIDYERYNNYCNAKKLIDLEGDVAISKEQYKEINNMIYDMQQEINKLREENARLQKRIDELESENESLMNIVNGNAKEVMIKEMHFQDGELTLAMKHPLFFLFQDAIMKAFIDTNAENYLETQFHVAGSNQDFVIIIQKYDKKSPHEIRVELEKENAELRKLLNNEVEQRR